MTTRRGVRVAARSLSSVALLGGGIYAVDEYNANIFSRSARVFSTGAAVILDYRKHLKGVDRADPIYKDILQGFNLRTANRLLDLFYLNGGIYTKFGQQVATFNHGLPQEYTQTMAKLQDQAMAVPFEQAIQTVEQELQKPWEQVFREFDRNPIASASLAQVHHAVDLNGREVAVKVQYPHLASQMAADIVVMKWALQLTEYFFPDVQVMWMFPEFKNALNSELDFKNEKQNSRRIAAHLKLNNSVYVPVVYDELSTKRVLTMEFITAPKISQLEEISKLGLEHKEVARVLCEVFSEMVFCHGFVHCDPHPGNIFVRQNPDSSAKTRAQIVLLDHGLYRELNENFRKTYCDLWRAILLRDTKLLEDCGKRLNVGPLAKYLPLLFTYRPLNSNAPLGASMSKEEREQVGEELRSLRFSNVSDFLEQLPRDMLFVFRTNNMIRSVNKDLGGSSRERFAVMGEYAVKGHATFYSASSLNHELTIWQQVKYWVDHVNLIFNLRIVDMVLAVIQSLKGDQLPKFKNHG